MRIWLIHSPRPFPAASALVQASFFTKSTATISELISLPPDTPLPIHQPPHCQKLLKTHFWPCHPAQNPWWLPVARRLNSKAEAVWIGQSEQNTEHGVIIPNPHLPTNEQFRLWASVSTVWWDEHFLTHKTKHLPGLQHIVGIQQVLVLFPSLCSPPLHPCWGSGGKVDTALREQASLPRYFLF